MKRSTIYVLMMLAATMCAAQSKETNFQQIAEELQGTYAPTAAEWVDVLRRLDALEVQGPPPPIPPPPGPVPPIPPPPNGWPSPLSGCETAGATGDGATSVGFAAPGMFHAPAPGSEEMAGRVIPVGAPSTFTSFAIDLDVRIGPVRPSAHDPEVPGNHGIVWAEHGKGWKGKLPAYFTYHSGAGKKPFVKLAHSLVSGQTDEGTRERVTLAEGEIYHFAYLWTPTRAALVVTEAETGKAVATVVDRKDSEPSALPASNGIKIHVGHPAENRGPEVPTYGWEYFNLCVRAWQ
jgi:hypothetical protein